MDFGDLPGRRNPNGRSAFLPKLNSAPFEATVSIIRHPGIGELLMSINPVLAGIAAVVALVSAQSVSAQNRPAAPAGQVPAANPTAPAIAEPADRLLKEMGVYIGSSEQFTFHANITFDHVLPSGQKLRFSAAQEVALQRPGRLYVEWNSDLGARQFWYDGKSITVYD